MTTSTVERYVALTDEERRQKRAAPDEMMAALAVIFLDPGIRNWLTENDPMALAQVAEALGAIDR
jgi:hypothetical protein